MNKAKIIRNSFEYSQESTINVNIDDEKNNNNNDVITSYDAGEIKQGKEHCSNSCCGDLNKCLEISSDFEKSAKYLENKSIIQCEGQFEDAQAKDTLQDDYMHPLSERRSPLGANYEEAISSNDSEQSFFAFKPELLNLESQNKIETTDLSRIRSMEMEQESLTSSLLSLTTHFAHLQLRVSQIVEAPPGERDMLLRDLNEFAFQGIPEPYSPESINVFSNSTLNNDSINKDLGKEERCKAIEHLTEQWDQLEKLPNKSSNSVLPQHIILEKQRVIIDELRSKLNLNVEEHQLSDLTSEELKLQIDNAFDEFVAPIKMKEKLVAQLKTQITDLERFIAFLQCDSDDCKIKASFSSDEKLTEVYNSYAAKKKRSSKFNIKQERVNIQKPANLQSISNDSSENGDNTKTPYFRDGLNEKAHDLMDKASLILNMFATLHFGSPTSFEKNKLKKTSQGNHWGDLRAQLEIDIQEIASLVSALNFDREKLASAKLESNKRQTLSTETMKKNKFDYESSKQIPDQNSYDCYSWQQSDQSIIYRKDSIKLISRDLVTLVRKNFAVTLQKLMEHGLRKETGLSATSIMVPFLSCFNPYALDTNRRRFQERECSYSNPESAEFVLFKKNKARSEIYNLDIFDTEYNGSQPMHAWELILEYYYTKNGVEFNNTPARKLSQSFGLKICNSENTSAKQSLLTTIGNIIGIHSPYKRSLNTHFKAFVIAGLNEHLLDKWLNAIYTCSDLIEAFYTKDSYVRCIGIRDSLESIDKLMKFDFNLPVDIAIRHFKNI